jgi:hypothetical protein
MARLHHLLAEVVGSVGVQKHGVAVSTGQRITDTTKRRPLRSLEGLQPMLTDETVGQLLANLCTTYQQSRELVDRAKRCRDWPVVTAVDHTQRPRPRHRRTLKVFQSTRWTRPSR